MLLSRRSFMRSAGYALASSTGHAINWDRHLTAPGGNPIMAGRGLCDPQVRVYDGVVYLYATHDAVPDSPYYLMKDWWVWRSTDLISWEQVSTLRPEQTYWKKPSNECWATDAIRYKGTYFFYFSRGPEEIGVVRGPSPGGPWEDPLGHALIREKSTPTSARDPGILQEEDGTTYIVFGCWDYYIARLNEDMISLAEIPRKVEVLRPEGPYGAGKMDDKPFLHRRGDLYYLSWGCFYATSKSPYGPFDYRDTIIKRERTAPEFSNHLTLDRHGSFFELHGQTYFICNDQDWPGASEHYRNSVISYVDYRDSGEIETLDLTRLGVARYDASMPIAAAHFFRGERCHKKESPDGGFEVRGIERSTLLVYPNIQGAPGKSRLTLRLACAHPGGATIEVRQGHPGGELLGRCKIPPSADWMTYRHVTCHLSSHSDTLDLSLNFIGGEGELLRLRSLSFS